MLARELERPNRHGMTPDDDYLLVADNDNSQGGARQLCRFVCRDAGSHDPVTHPLLHSGIDAAGAGDSRPPKAGTPANYSSTHSHPVCSCNSRSAISAQGVPGWSVFTRLRYMCGRSTSLAMLPPASVVSDSSSRQSLLSGRVKF